MYKRQVVNEAALRAVRDGRKFATQADFEAVSYTHLGDGDF